MAGMSGGFGGSTVSQTKRDINLQQGSNDDRWQICETCLGPNPFVRMMKLPMSRECKISTRPYTAFRFRPGKEARWKETIICYEVAVAKNVCQVCLFDMQFQLPTAVIDKYMRDKGEGGAADVPESDVGRDYFWNQQIAAQENGGAGPTGMKMAGYDPSGTLLKLARTTPYYERNRAKVCSFWLGGSCNRVEQGSCPFRPCNGDFRFPELNRDEDMKRKLNEMLKSDGPAKVMKLLDPEIKMKIKEQISGNRDEKIRSRYHGRDDDLAKSIMGRADERLGGGSLAAPADKSITTLWVGGVDESVSESDLRDCFYAHGEIASVRMVPKSSCAFVTYTTRSGAELACERLHNRLTIKGQRLKLQWGKPQKSRIQGEGQGQAAAGVAAGAAGAAYAAPQGGTGAAVPVAGGGLAHMPAAVGSEKVRYASSDSSAWGSKMDGRGGLD